MTKSLNEFKVKYVQGLYSYNHFEAENGEWVQIHVRGDHVVFQSLIGERKEFNSYNEFKLWWTKRA